MKCNNCGADTGSMEYEAYSHEYARQGWYCTDSYSCGHRRRDAELAALTAKANAPRVGHYSGWAV